LASPPVLLSFRRRGVGGEVIGFKAPGLILGFIPVINNIAWAGFEKRCFTKQDNY
jgi:hypothetical protein